MILEGASDLAFVSICPLDAPPAEGMAAVLTKDRKDEARLRQLCADGRIIVQEVWKELLPDAPLLISSAICGGDIRARFQEAAAQRQCYLLLEPVRMRFPLPCRDGQGAPMTEAVQGVHFYSEPLCCYYAHTTRSVVLWDTEETLEKKILLAQSAGFLGIVCK